MCGIFGVIDFKNKIDSDKIIRSRDILKHRGPDDEGLYLNEKENVALAHRRLSIIDLSPAGHQPMTTEDGRFIIVYNGEIYNYLKLRQKIKEQSIKLNSYSDTEVILQLYSLHGKDCLNMLRGMFAFAIWDNKENKLFAARDRFGIKPYYYLHNEGNFVFSSELKAIKHYRGNLSISMEGIDAFLRTGSVPAPLTIYNETTSLLPGQFLEVDLSGEIKTGTYWTFSDLIQDHTSIHSFNHAQRYDDNAKALVRNSLLDSVRLHCVSDVEVGAFLSGGIDSSAIVSLMRQNGQEKIKTISVTFPGNKLDESKYSRIAAEQYKTDHYEYKFTENELLDDFDKIIEQMDQPTIDGINTYFVSKAASSFGLKVVMSGIGGDELFGGYSSFKNIPKMQSLKKIPFAKAGMKIAGKILRDKLPAKAIEYFKNPDELNAEYKLMRGLFTDAEINSLGWHHSFNHPFENVISRESPTEKSFTALQYISYLESCFYMRNQLLRDSDIFSMTHSLELRVPFVDHILYSDVLPFLNNGYDRKHQKNLLVEGTGNLPAGVINRQKMGFTFPFEDWIMNGTLNRKVTGSLNSLSIKNMFNKEELIKIQNLFQNNKMHWSRIWSLFIIEAFLN